MTDEPRRRRRAPRLLFKILGFSFAVIAVILGAALLLLSWQTRAQVTLAVLDGLETSQTRLSQLEVRRQRERRLQATVLAESPTLKASVDTFVAERAVDEHAAQLLETVRQELSKLQQTMDLPLVAVTNLRGLILTSAGPAAADWPPGQVVPRAAETLTDPTDAVVMMIARPFLATIVPLRLGDEPIAHLVLASALDDAYARELSTAAGTDIAIRVAHRVVGTSASPVLRAAAEGPTLPASGEITDRNGDRVVVRRILAVDSADVYALAPAAAAVREATGQAAWMFGQVSLVALVLAGVGSLWLAHTLANPIDALRLTLAEMAAARDFERPLPPGGSSYELDALGETFDTLRDTIARAETESEATYLGVIGMLATALDARDPYTAGHSGRVAALAVAVARELRVPEPEIEVLRLGALLHDIGKIGVPDAVLRKPGTLTDEEFEQIKQHPTLGARILRPLHFLAEHLAIVELHHEQPDGRGYPFGLVGDATPLFARVVHVADAFDAMTTARAYRPGRSVNDAMAELWRHAGTGFDQSVVQAMARLSPELLLAPPPVVADASTPPHLGGALVPFRIRATGAGRRAAV